jgi:hypothetical protein
MTEDANILIIGAGVVVLKPNEQAEKGRPWKK